MKEQYLIDPLDGNTPAPSNIGDAIFTDVSDVSSLLKRSEDHLYDDDNCY